jgi:hypothetical protein
MDNQNKQAQSSQYSCAFHPGEVAKWACQSCKSLFCDACIVHKSVGKFKAHICPKPECRGRCVPVRVDEFSGSVEEAAPPKEEVKSLIKRDASPVKRYLTRYYLSLFIPAFTLIAYDIMLFFQGRKPLLWLVVAWGLLIFLMSGRYFWAYVFVATICFLHVAYSIYRIYAHTLFKDSNQLVNWISIGLWLASFLILACSHSEFSE